MIAGIRISILPSGDVLVYRAIKLYHVQMHAHCTLTPPNAAALRQYCSVPNVARITWQGWRDKRVWGEGKTTNSYGASIKRVTIHGGRFRVAHKFSIFARNQGNSSDSDKNSESVHGCLDFRFIDKDFVDESFDFSSDGLGENLKIVYTILHWF